MAMSRSLGGRSLTSRSRYIFSGSRSSKPATIRRAVDFPHPEGAHQDGNSCLHVKSNCFTRPRFPTFSSVSSTTLAMVTTRPPSCIFYHRCRGSCPRTFVGVFDGPQAKEGSRKERRWLVSQHSKSKKSVLSPASLSSQRTQSVRSFSSGRESARAKKLSSENSGKCLAGRALSRPAKQSPL